MSWKFWMAVYFVTWQFRSIAPRQHQIVNDKLAAAVKRRYPII
jgi:hypothetical protein